MRIRLQHILFLFLALVFSAPSFAQDGVKKSSKTQVIDGKKYYIHKVEKGQTLYAIAKAYDLAVNDIILENPDAINGIRNGQELKIPFNKPVVTNNSSQANVTSRRDTLSYFWHKVEQGQTLYSISKIYAVKVEEIEKLNPEAKQGLKSGQQIKIPGTKKLVTTVPVFLDSPGVRKDSMPFVENKKDVYEIALFMPVQLWRANDLDVNDLIRTKDKFPQPSELSLQFYEGFLMALDTMQKRGMKVKLHVYDSDENDSTSIGKTLKRPEMQNMDLYVGPFFPGPFQDVAKLAESRNRCIVSPVSQSNRVLFGHATAAKAAPSIMTQMEVLAKHVLDNHKGKKVVVISSGNPKEAAYVKAFSTTYDQLRSATGKDTVPVLRGMGGLSAYLGPDTTIIIAPTSSQAFVTDLTRGLNEVADKNKLIVYGTASWINYDNLDYEYLQAINFHFTTPYFVDYSDSLTKIVARKYASLYKGDANQYVLMGYDIGNYYLDALYRYGTGFYTRMPEMKSYGYQQGFHFVKSDEGSGYENRAVNIVRMIDFKLVKWR